jgi:molybdopterin-guanine dinucleotide biosynthesis protein A
MATSIHGDQITAMILSGGRGTRMGGADKGLQSFRGQPLVCAVLERLAAQTLRPARMAINANRHPERYAAIGTAVGAPVWPDNASAQPGNYRYPFSGPLAGILTGLERASTPYLLIVPCDAPRLSLSLCERLAQALQHDLAVDLAVAVGLDDATAQAQLQPMFCLLRRDVQGRLARDLSAWLNTGERQARTWIARQRYATAHFDASADGSFAFANINTMEQLRRLEQR